MLFRIVARSVGVTRNCRALAAVVPAFVAVMTLVGCDGSAPVSIVAVTTSRTDPLALVVSAAACHRQPYTVVAKESSLQVHVGLTARRYHGQTEAACSDGVVVHLREPLGTRSVVDDSTGNLVTVQPG